VTFTYLKVKSASAFVYFRWSWSCYFSIGLGIVNTSGLGLKNLVLLTSLTDTDRLTDDGYQLHNAPPYGDGA